MFMLFFFFFFFQAEDGIRDHCVTGVQTCALPISRRQDPHSRRRRPRQRLRRAPRARRRAPREVRAARRARERDRGDALRSRTARRPSEDRVGEVRGARGRRATGDATALEALSAAPVMVLRLDGVTKVFGAVRALDGASLEVERGEIFTLLGPSGCGKTTTLRLVAGLEHPDAGEIALRGRIVASVPRRVFVAPHKRNLGMVFQSYAIWPHMNVFENVAYPLRLRGVKRSVVAEKVTRVLDLVGLAGLDERGATLLSGGQMQRLALCRALVYEPDLLLLDEPFSNLDAKLREQMRVELKVLQRRLGVTVLFVTHDQIEALSLSDRIAVMHRGRVEQVGPPRCLYEE